MPISREVIEKKIRNSITELDTAITNSIKKNVEDLANFGILYSAGLDSSLIVKICDELGKKPVLYSVGTKESKDFEYIEKSRKIFDFEIRYKEIGLADIEVYTKKVINIIKTYNPMDVGIGIAEYAACEMAEGGGIKTMLSGQGADELFAGYYRYLKMSKVQLRKELPEDLKEAQRACTKRDNAIARENSIELRTPYLDEGVVEIALDMDVALKIKAGKRKYILREVAKRHDLPGFIADREKKAVQYSTGVDKALRKVAMGKGKSLEEYLRLCVWSS